MCVCVCVCVWGGEGISRDVLDTDESRQRIYGLLSVVLRMSCVSSWEIAEVNTAGSSSGQTEEAFRMRWGRCGGRKALDCVDSMKMSLRVSGVFW